MAEQLGTLDVAVQTDIGRKRKRNEDYYDLHIPEPGTPQHAYGALFVVADGMGGMGGGDAASQTAVHALFEHYYAERSPHITPLSALKAALEAANAAVRHKAREMNLARIGSTAAGVLLLPNGEAQIFNVGDARVYRVRQGFIEQLSHDQSVLQHQIDAGVISAEQARQSRNVNVTAFLGQATPLEAVHRKVQVQPGDVFVLCSDGLWDLVTPHEMLRIVDQYPAEQATRRLVELALKRGAPDNVTVLVLRIGASPASRNTRRVFFALPILLLLLAAVVWFAFQREKGNASPTSVTLTPAAANAAELTASPTLLTSPSETPHAPSQVAVISVFTDTPSHTPNVSATPTASATLTPSVTPSPTHTHTPTLTASYTATPSVTPSATFTASVTPSLTHTPPPSATPTATWTPSLTPTPTLTPTPHPPTATLDPNVISPTPTTPPTATPTLSPPELMLWLAREEGVRLAQDMPLLLFQEGTLQAPFLLNAGTLVQLTDSTPMPNPQNPAVVLHEVQVLDGNWQGRSGWLPQKVLEKAQPLQPRVVCHVEDGCRVRAGDGINYVVVVALDNGETARVRGISSTGSGWLAITTNNGVDGWIAPHVVTVLGNLRSVSTLVPPPSPVPSDTPVPFTATPTAAGG